MTLSVARAHCTVIIVFVSDYVPERDLVLSLKIFEQDMSRRKVKVDLTFYLRFLKFPLK